MDICPEKLKKLDIVEETKTRNGIMEQIKSRAVVKYSAVHLPTDFARLQCNTNLNLPPSNWLTSYAESYGLHHTLANTTGFSSFRMAHMFPDCITEVDVVSDAENIKKLLKIPYSRNGVSMMVHCIEKTLLIDEFDVHKHLLRTAETDWEWLRKFFFEHVLQTLSGKNLGVSAKDKSRHALQERALVSKFLHYSLTEPELSSQEPMEESPDNNQDTVTKMWPPLPEPKLEEQLPDPSTNHTFNRNVVWTFEDIQMLLGTDLPIFGGTTHPCISLRLRDANKPISVLTGIDYWLDNLMCNVPEVVMCYHLDGIVQRYELIKTEDLPHLANSKFSPNLIRDVAQNILSFLKSNATKAGHTYWLFKGKDEDVVKLYDLTSLCSESLVDQGQNPFTVPVAMLLYRVARNMKHSVDRSTMQPGTIRALLNNCLMLLPKEKYPQIVTSAHYMLSDLYIPLGVSPECLQDETASVSPEPPDCNTSPINILCITDDLDPPPLPQYEPPPHVVGSMVERCDQALQHVVAGLQCLQFFDIASPPNNSSTRTGQTQNDPQPEPEMAHPHQPIPMPYSSLTPEKSKEDKSEEAEGAHIAINKKKSKKKKNNTKNTVKLNKEKQVEDTSNLKNNEIFSSIEQFPVYFWNSGKTALLHKQQSVPLPTWQVPNPSDTASWKGHLKTLLYEKACLVYSTLAEAEHSAKRYGKSLRCVGLLLRSHAHMAAVCGRCTSLVSGVLSLAGDNCFHLAQDFNNIECHRADYSAYSDTDTALIAEMALDMPSSTYPYECMIMPETLESEEQLMLSSLSCYQQALLLKPCDALHSRIGNVHNELSTFYMNKVNSLGTKNLDDPAVRSKINTLLKLCQHHLDLGKAEFTKLNDKYNTALLLANSGRLMRMKALYLSCLDLDLQYVQRSYYDNALSLYDKGLGMLGNRKAGPLVWDVIRWEKSSTLFTMATVFQDSPPAVTEKSQEEVEREMVDLFTKAIQSCDLETSGPRLCIYQYRAAILHSRLANLYHLIYRRKQIDDAKRKHILHLANLHYEKSALLMERLEHPLDFLRLQVERVALQEFIAENSAPPGKLKALQTALDFLISCSPVLKTIAETRATNPSHATANDGCVEKNENEEEEDNLLALYEARVQFVLKSLVKVTISSTNPKVSSLASKYKTMYSLVLKQDSAMNLAAHLNRVAVGLKQLLLS